MQAVKEINQELDEAAHESGVDLLAEYNLELLVKSHIRDLTKSQLKVQKETAEMFLSPNSFRPDTIYQTIV